MKYVFTENTQEAQEAEDAVLELEYKDLLPIIKKASFKDTSTLEPRSFAKLQLRAINALKTLMVSKTHKVMLLCGVSSVDTIDLANELVQNVAKVEPTIAYAPTKFELFGSDKEDGVLTSDGFVIMPCSHLIDHPKWLGMADACLAQNTSLKLVLCGDANDIANLNMMWPTLDNVLRADIVLEFSIVGAMEMMGSLVASYKEKFGVKDFDNRAIELLCIWSTRQSGDRRYIGIPELKLISLVTEANQYSKGSVVTYNDVLKAIGAADFRLNYLAQMELRNHRDDQILLDTEGEVTGQINGLSVIETAGTT